MTLNNDGKFQEKLICCFKNDENLVNFLKIPTFIGFFCAKYLTFDLKKYGGVTFHDTEE